MLSYENLIDDLGIDNSPKIFSYIKNGKNKAKSNINTSRYSIKELQNGYSTCKIRASIEWVSSSIMGEAMNEVGEEVGHENIFNFNYKEFSEKNQPSWPFLCGGPIIEIFI